MDFNKIIWEGVEYSIERQVPEEWYDVTFQRFDKDRNMQVCTTTKRAVGINGKWYIVSKVEPMPVDNYDPILGESTENTHTLVDGIVYTKND